MYRARDYGITGTGIDMSPLFTAQAKLRAEELGVSEHVHFIHNDAAGCVADEKCDVAACVGATGLRAASPGRSNCWQRALSRRTGAYRRTVLASGACIGRDCPGLWRLVGGRFLTPPDLVASFDEQGYDRVEMVLADRGRLGSV